MNAGRRDGGSFVYFTVCIDSERTPLVLTTSVDASTVEEEGLR